jgi:hypothetical protein
MEFFAFYPAGIDFPDMEQDMNMLQYLYAVIVVPLDVLSHTELESSNV